MPSRREIDHIGAYNFRVEIDGIEAGHFKGVDGLAAEELVAALHVLNDAAVLHLAGDGDGHRWSLALYDHVTMTVQFGIDEIHDAFEGGS